jgi:hypothetical protein
MFLCRELPHAYRIRPSRGDGGVDVCVPVSPGHVEIYQVKKFAENLSSNQKQQIVKSHKRIQKYAKKRNWTIDKWHLTLPLERTPENDEWLEKLEATSTFPCKWVGLAPIEGWAAEHSDIIDYYLEGGRERLQEEIAKWAAIARMPMSGPLATTPQGFANLEPAAVEHQLATLRDTLNKRDPHFQYDITISNQPAEPPRGTGGYPALVASTSRQIGDSYVTFHVLAKCAEALNERPITVTGTLTVRTGSDEDREFTEFQKFGRVPTVPLDITDLVVNMPGGLGGEFAAGRVILGQPQTEGTFERRLAVLSRANEKLAEVDLTMGPTRTNHDGTGLSVHGTDSADFLSVEMLSEIRDGTTNMKVRLHRKDPTGHFPDKIEQALALLYHFKAPNRMRLAQMRGYAQHIQDIPAAPRSADSVEWNEFLLRYVNALIAVQQYTTVELKIPDLAHEDFHHVEELLQAARLLAGEVLEAPWERIRFTLHAGITPPEELQQAIFQQELNVVIGGETIELGAVLVAIDVAEVANTRTESNGAMTAELVPALGQDIAHLRWLGQASIAQPSNSSDE